ncbi:MAG TPA: ASCH domain-containing protein [Alloacidobacterium sp.]|nr:ASCH domain-containing protein [Alloacidobacterium sp.]
MKALSVRAPWWWFILHGGKDVENRDWRTSFRGTVLLHASKWWNNGEIEDALSFCDRIAGDSPSLLDVKEACGHIVGKVDIVGCAIYSTSPWFFGRYGFVLANPVAFKTPIPCKGALGFFDVPDELIGAAE